MSSHAEIIRLENIKRNQEYLELLGLGKGQVLSEINDENETIQKKNSNSLLDTIKPIDTILDKFPHRQYQIQVLYNMLLHDHALKPIIISGLSSSGKYTISSSVCELFPEITIKILCSLHKSIRHFINELWFATIDNVKKRLQSYIIHTKEENIKNTNSHNMLNYINSLYKLSPPKHTNDFIALLSNILKELSSMDINTSCLRHHNTSTLYSNTIYNDTINNLTESKNAERNTTVNNIFIRIILKNVDHIDSLEKGLLYKLLSLSQLCHPGIQVIATVLNINHITLSNINTYPATTTIICQHIPFPPYTQNEVIDILKYKISINTLNTYEMDKQSEYTFGNTNVYYNNMELSMNQPILDDQKKKCIFNKIIDLSMSKLYIYTKNIRILCQQIYALYRMIQNVIQYIKQPFISENITLSVIQECIQTLYTTSGVYVYNQNISHVYMAPHKIKLQLKRKIVDIIHKKDNNATDTQVTSDQTITKSHSDISISKSTVISSSYSADRTIKNNSTAPMMSASDKLKCQEYLSAYHSYEDIKSRLSNMSLIMKYLILAAYIASQNAKESDTHIFGMSQRGRRSITKRLASKSIHGQDHKRKKQDKSNMDFDSTTTATTTSKIGTTTSNNSIYYDSTTAGTMSRNQIKQSATAYEEENYIYRNNFMSLRRFTLERLFGIFGQIATICGIQMIQKPSYQQHLSISSTSTSHSYLSPLQEPKHNIGNTENPPQQQQQYNIMKESNNNTGSNYQIKSFLNPSERATLSFGKQINTISTRMELEEIARIYGNSYLFSSVRTLCEQQLLISSQSAHASTSTTIEILEEVYESHISYDLAITIARSLQFPLNDFILQDD